MTKDELRADRDRLQTILDRFESGHASAFEEDERGYLERDVTPERIDSIRARIADIDRMLADDWRA